MSIPQRLGDFFHHHHVPYDVSWHKEAHSSLAAARAAHLTPALLVKGVVLQAEDRLVMVVVPGDKSVSLPAVENAIKRHVALAEPVQFEHVFSDCVPGSIPPVGPVYGLETLLDRSVADAKEVYFESGDREEMIHLKGEAYRAVLANAVRGNFCAPAPTYP